MEQISEVKFSLRKQLASMQCNLSKVTKEREALKKRLAEEKKKKMSRKPGWRNVLLT
jgi:hypothetical protein